MLYLLAACFLLSFSRKIEGDLSKSCSRSECLSVDSSESGDEHLLPTPFPRDVDMADDKSAEMSDTNSKSESDHLPTPMLSTASFPPCLLEATRLVGNSPFISLESDTRLSYSVHVPSEHYNPDPYATGPFFPRFPPRYSMDGRAYQVPAADLEHPYNLPRIPLVVVVHGSTREAAADRDRFSKLHPYHYATMAPLFPAGLEDRNDWDSYKKPGEMFLNRRKLASISAGEPLYAGAALIAMLKEVGQRWPGIDTNKIILAGFSGGGSFALNFAAMHPERVRAVSVGAPTSGPPRSGWDWQKIKEIVWQLVVGSNDRSIEGSLQGVHRKMMAEVDLAEMEGRAPDLEKVKTELTIDRQTLLVEIKQFLQEHDVNSTLVVVPGVGHSPAGVAPDVQAFVSSMIQKYKSEKDGGSSGSPSSSPTQRLSSGDPKMAPSETSAGRGHSSESNKRIRIKHPGRMDD